MIFLRLLKKLILAYSIGLPYHPGKWRVIEALIRFSRTDRLDRNQSFRVKRGGIWWNLSPDCWVQRTLYYHGDWDTYEMREIIRRLPDEPVFLDVGSYFGYYAMMVSLLTDSNGIVYAFEPFSANHRLLLENKGLNDFPNLHIHKLALLDRSGLSKMEIPPVRNRGIGRIVSDSDTGHVEHVPCTTLDQFVLEQALKKLTIERFRPTMLLELNPSALRRFGSSPVELLSTIRALHYDTLVPSKHGLKPFSGEMNIREYINLLCIPI
jgi:FkbM family methyltransferase